MLQFALFFMSLLVLSPAQGQYREIQDKNMNFYILNKGENAKLLQINPGEAKESNFDKAEKLYQKYTDKRIFKLDRKNLVSKITDSDESDLNFEDLKILMETKYFPPEIKRVVQKAETILETGSQKVHYSLGVGRKKKGRDFQGVESLSELGPFLHVEGVTGRTVLLRIHASNLEQSPRLRTIYDTMQANTPNLAIALYPTGEITFRPV